MSAVESAPIIEPLRKWIKKFVLQENVIKYWAGLRLRPQCIKNLYTILKVTSGHQIKLVLSAQYVQLFGDRYPEMRLPRVPQVIGEEHVQLAENFEVHAKKYFDAPPLTNTIVGTPLYTRFKGDRFFPSVFPRATLLRSIVAQLLVAAEMEGVLFPALLLLKTVLRKVFIKNKLGLVMEIEAELLRPQTIWAITDRCRVLALSARPGAQKRPRDA